MRRSPQSHPKVAIHGQPRDGAGLESIPWCIGVAGKKFEVLFRRIIHAQEE
jgi:hypothetical protein